MPFTVSGLPPEHFAPLYGLSDQELAGRLARRILVDGPGFPERIEMRDAEPGETVLLVNYEHQPARTAFRSSHAVYVREGATETWRGDHVPQVMRPRLLSLRGFSADHEIAAADVVDGSDAETLIERLFGDSRVAYIHAHYARLGCYAGRIDRA